MLTLDLASIGRRGMLLGITGYDAIDQVHMRAEYEWRFCPFCGVTTPPDYTVYDWNNWLPRCPNCFRLLWGVP